MQIKRNFVYASQMYQLKMVLNCCFSIKGDNTLKVKIGYKETMDGYTLGDAILRICENEKLRFGPFTNTTIIEYANKMNMTPHKALE